MEILLQYCTVTASFENMSCVQELFKRCLFVVAQQIEISKKRDKVCKDFSCFPLRFLLSNI